MSGRRERVFKSSAGTMGKPGTVTASGPHGEKYLYPISLGISARHG